MPGFLGGSSAGSGGTGGEILFPKEFIDPVTKLRVSQPENLIDTDFEYGLQPTKWETVELINNTPSFFSKSGDTTIDGIQSVITNNGTREITVTTGLDHGLAVGIPISVTGTKSVTADGSYIINSIPNSRTFTYLCRDNQVGDNSIEDLYTSIITGEFFQGSQIRVAAAEGVITDGEPISTLTVKTDSTHGFGTSTPFYFLNLNSTISQEFEAANTAAKSFDSSNSATAQTFDGSNTLSSLNIDWSNSATVGGTPSSIVSVDTNANTITVTHGAESFLNSRVGTPLYYAVTTSTGFFANNPLGVVFLKTVDQLAQGTSIFQVSEVPDGSPIDIQASMNGTFQLANQARAFAGNNVNADTQITIEIVNQEAKVFDGGNTQSTSGLQSGVGTVTSYSGGGLVNIVTDSGLADINFYSGAMVRYTTTGSPATGLVNNTTYFIETFFQQGSTNAYSFTLRTLPAPGGSAVSPSGGTGTQKFSSIGVSIDRDIFNIRDHGYTKGDMLRYDPPAGGTAFSTESAEQQKNYYYVDTVYDAHNFSLSESIAPDGSSPARAAVSALAILEVNPTAPDGAYWIKPANYEGDPFLVHCYMSIEGGGWMLALRLETSNFGAANRTPFASGAPFVGNWAGWGFTTAAQVNGAVPNNTANYATVNGLDAFSPVYIASPFNDVMVIANRDAGRRLGWRHNTQIPNMRSAIMQTNVTLGNSQLFATNGGRAGWWFPTLDKRPDAQNGSDRGFNLYGFKIGADRHGNNFAGQGTGSQMTGGWPVGQTGSGGNTYNASWGGWYNAQIGWAATDQSTAEITGQIGGGFGGICAAGSYHRLNHHAWGWGSSRNQSTWDADRSQPYYGHAVYVREL
jgi:hypothetical protein